MHTILIGADREILGLGLGALLEEHGHSIVATLTPEAALERAPRIANLSVVMLELDEVDRERAAKIGRFGRAFPATPIILLADHLDVRATVAAGRARAQGLLFMDAPLDQIAQCVETVLGGGRWLDARHQRAVEALARGGNDARAEALLILTPREREIVGLCSDGLGGPAIAERLDISESTVKVHFHSIYKKLGVDNRRALRLLLAGILDEPCADAVSPDVRRKQA